MKHFLTSALFAACTVVTAGAETFPADKPTAAPSAVYPRDFQDTVTVALATATAGAKLYYTLDGSVPDETNGKLYAGPILITETATLKAIAAKKGMTNSAVATNTYVKVATLKINGPISWPPPGSYVDDSVAVSLSASPEGATIYYTLDDSDPTLASTLYTGHIVLRKTTVIRAVAIAPGYPISDPVVTEYVLWPSVSVRPAGPATPAAQGARIDAMGRRRGERVPIPVFPISR